uniref:Integrase, catalytic region, zinc finger, CCHC-type, peptidase aspartic, catalytic n=1 Tax=Tanacetum cinerariifolium TaxID=118510 RepID=A0A6L2NEG9_TANCI|nr:hypothetical protein [Tanacetum cinerariifolium]
MYFDKRVDRTKLMTDKYIWFRLCRVEKVLTYAEFAVLLGIYEEDELNHSLSFERDHYEVHGDGYHAGSIVPSLGYEIRGSSAGFHGEDFDPIMHLPSMLDRTDFASWKQRIRLYCRGPERPRVYSDLSPEEKERYNADIRATNILLQGLPKDIYTLINHYTDAKDIWHNVKMLLEGSELTKEDRESQLYDDLKHFRQNKGETIYDYYVRFAKIINDMQNIKMTMSRMQLNSKFVNNMLPEWDRFVTEVKLNIAFTYVQPHFTDNTQLDSVLSLTDNLIKNLTNTLALLTQPYKTYLPQSNNQLRTSSNTRNQAIVQDGEPKRPHNSEYFIDKMLLMQAKKNKVALDEEQLLFIAGEQDNVVDDDIDEQPAPTAQTMFMANLSFAYPVYDEASLSYDSNILSEVPDHDNYQDADCELHEVHEMHDDV